MKVKYIALLAALLMSGCGAEGSSSVSEVSSAAETTAAAASEAAAESVSDSQPEAASALGELCEKLKAADSSVLTGSAAYGERLFEKNCKKLYLCEQSDLTDGLIVYNNGGGKADEISVIKPADGNTDTAVKVLNDRKELRYNDFKGYVPAELPKIEAGRVFTVNGWCVLVISDSADSLEKLVREELS